MAVKKIMDDNTFLANCPPTPLLSQHFALRDCLHGSGEPQVGEVTRLGGVKKNNPPLRVILQPRHPGVHIFKITEWLLST